MRILIVEDDESVANVLQKVLTDEHYAVDVVTDGHVGWQMVSAAHYDLVVLDVMLPKLDGLEFCQRLRDRAYNMPVLLVTALDSSTKKVAGLNAGADDYITKPFDPDELLARVRALLRRGKMPVSLTLKWGELCLEPNSREVFYQDNNLSLTPKEYALLELFLRNPSQVFSRGAILDHLWSAGEAPGEETVTSHMKGLRRKLSSAGAPANFVETVYGVGYRLKPGVKPVESVTSSEAKSARSGQANLRRSTDRDLSNKDSQSAESIRQSEVHQQKTKAALTTLWRSVKFKQIERIERLQKALRQLEAGQMSEKIRQSVRQDAHGLAGVLGIFGLVTGSELAREIQHLLQGKAPIASEERSRLKVLIESIESMLHQPIEASEPPKVPLLVLVDPQLNLTPTLVSLLWEEQLTVKISPHLESLQTLCTALSSAQSEDVSHLAIAKDALPDVVLLNFSFQNAEPDQVRQLSALASQVPSLMLLVCSAEGSLESRVKASQLGNVLFLYSPDIIDVVNGIKRMRFSLAEAAPSHPQQPTQKKILVVDDDPQVLAALRARLEPQGFQLVTLSKPLKFWQTLQEAAPDLLLLDISMPEFSGIELCQVVRQAPAWSHLPIVFFTSAADVHVQQAAFRAGANDLVEKSSSHSELLAHLHEQLQRSQVQRAIAAIADRSADRALSASP